MGVLGQTTTKEGNKEEKEKRKEGKKGKRGKTDRDVSQRKKGKGKKGKQTLANFLCFYVYISIYIYIYLSSLCVIGQRTTATFLSQKTENLVFKILKKLFL